MNGSKVIRNAAWIIIGKIMQSLLGLLVTMFTARYLGPSNYGLLNYAASLIAFATPIMQLGLNSILVQEFINNKDREGETLGTAIVMNCCSSLMTIAGIIAFVTIANHNEEETILVCALYSILLLFQGLEIIECWFQAKLLSKYTSIISLGAYLVVSLYKIYLLITQKSIYWFAISQSIDIFIIVILLFYIYKKIESQHLSFSLIRAKQMFSRGKYYILSNLMVTIFAQTDRVMLKLMVNDAATGYYSAAVTCACMTGFIFAAIIDSARPSIFESKLNGEASFENNISRLYSIIIYFALIQSAVITVFAYYIIKLIYGSSYLPAVSALQVVVWYTTFAYIGAVRNIWILGENLQKYLWVINLSGAIANVLLNLALIPIWGIIGAAIASLATQIFTNVIIGFIIGPIYHNNEIMLKSLNPHILLDVIKKVRINGWRV